MNMWHRSFSWRKFPLDSPAVGVRNEPSQAGEDAGTQAARPPTSSRSEQWHPGGGSGEESLSLPGSPLGWQRLPPMGAPLAGTPNLVSGSLPHSPSPWLALSPTLPGSLPTKPPTTPAQTDSGTSQKSRRDRDREKTLLLSSLGQWPGSEVGTGQGEDGPLVSLRTGGRRRRRPLFAVPRGEGPDLAWSASGLAGGRGASGCLLGSPPSPRSPFGQDSSL